MVDDVNKPKCPKCHHKKHWMVGTYAYPCEEKDCGCWSYNPRSQAQLDRMQPDA